MVEMPSLVQVRNKSIVCWGVVPDTYVRLNSLYIPLDLTSARQS